MSALGVCLVYIFLPDVMTCAEGREIPEDYPVRSIRVPVERYDNGSLKIQLYAEAAKVLEAGNVSMIGMIIEFYTPDGQVDGRVTSEDCLYIVRNKDAYSKKAVRVEAQGMVLTGTGFELHAGEDLFEILNDACFVACRGVTNEVSGATNTVITSQRMEVDYYRNVVFFDEDVKIIDPMVTMTADKMTVLFESTNQLKSATAHGNVHFVGDAMTAECEKAVYIAGGERVIMTGGAAITSDEGGRLLGDKITMWSEGGRIVSEPGLLIIPEKRKETNVVSRTETGFGSIFGKGL